MAPENFGLDPNIVLRRWCELECSAYTELTCNGNADPSPAEIGPISHSMFTSEATRNPACVAACDAALPGLLGRSHPISQYFVQNDGVRIARELRRGDPDNQRCGPPPQRVRVPAVRTAPAESPMARSAFEFQSPSAETAVVVGFALALGIAALCLGPEVLLLAAI